MDADKESPDRYPAFDQFVNGDIDRNQLLQTVWEDNYKQFMLIGRRYSLGKLSPDEIDDVVVDFIVGLPQFLERHIEKVPNRTYLYLALKHRIFDAIRKKYGSTNDASKNVSISYASELDEDFPEYVLSAESGQTGDAPGKRGQSL